MAAQQRDSAGQLTVARRAPRASELLWDVWEILDQEYIDPDAIDRDEMIYGAAAGMVATLGDTHTAFVEPAAAANYGRGHAGLF